MKKAPGIPFFIGSRLLLLFAAFVLCYSFIVNHVYLMGMDEATSYYMSTEAELVMQSYETGEPVMENIEGYREYYWPGQLPQKYQQMFPDHHDKLNQLLMVNSSDMVTFLLPGGLTTIELYVVHILPDVEPTDQGSMSVRQMQLVAGVSALLALIAMSAWFIYRLVSATMVLSRWAAQLNSDKPDSFTLPEKGLHFKELHQLAQKLAASAKKVAEVSQREQQFLRSLSHELRTPIAVTSAALDILDKKNIESTTVKLTAKIRRATTTMRSLTETILWLWREPEQNQTLSEQKVHPVVEQALDDNQYLLKRKNVVVENRLPPELTVKVDKTLLNIVCNNLVRNAFQYCDDGKVVIIGDQRGLVIGNGYAKNSEISPGFGLGLLIVRRIADNYGWQIEINDKDGTFELAIRFD